MYGMTIYYGTQAVATRCEDGMTSVLKALIRIPPAFRRPGFTVLVTYI